MGGQLSLFPMMDEEDLSRGHGDDNQSEPIGSCSVKLDTRLLCLTLVLTVDGMLKGKALARVLMIYLTDWFALGLKGDAAVLQCWFMLFPNTAVTLEQRQG